MNRQIKAGHEILLDTQFGNKEGVPDILRMHEQMDFPVHGDGHFRGHDIVFGVRIVLRIEAEKILIALADVVGVNGSELSIRPRIAKVKRKLSSLHLDGQSIRGGWSEIDAGPGLRSEHTECQYLRTYQQESRDNQSHGAAWKVPDLGARFRAGEFPDKERQEEL